MLHLTVPETPGFPVLWWAWWFAVAFVIYAILAIWFWTAARRHDESVSHGGKTGVSKET